MGSPIDFSTLIPDLQGWNAGRGIDVGTWLNIRGDIPLAIAFSNLFWPEFAEFDGCVFRAGFSEESYRGFLLSCKGDRTAVEAVMNHRHMLDLFQPAAPTATAAQLIYLGRIMKRMLEAKLSSEFPGRSFEVHFDDGPLDDLLDYQLTFWQSRNN